MIPVTLSFLVIGHLTRIRLITARICHESRCLARENFGAAPKQSWRDREDPRGKSRAAFRFREGRENDRTGFRHLVEIREQLDLVMVVPQHISLERVVILGRRQSGIGVGGFVTGRGCVAFFVDETERRQTPPRIVRDSVDIAVFHRLPIRPAYARQIAPSTAVDRRE